MPTISAWAAAFHTRSQGHPIGRTAVWQLLHAAGYSLQGARKTREGSSHVDRNAQFEYINAQATTFLKGRRPVISVDTKKKELVGDFKNGGREWRPRGRPPTVRVHDFVIEELGKVAPYGVYDLANNMGWVGVGISHDTAEPWPRWRDGGSGSDVGASPRPSPS